jgi:hypothetical protein
VCRGQNRNKKPQAFNRRKKHAQGISNEETKKTKDAEWNGDLEESQIRRDSTEKN